MIPAETVLDSSTEYDWKIQPTGTMKKLEDRFNKEVHIPIAKQPPTVKEKNTATIQTAASAMMGKVIPGVDHIVDFPPTYDVEELDLSHNPTITADNNSAYHPTDEDLDVKLPSTMKAQDVLLEDFVPTSIPSPHTATTRIAAGEQLNISQDFKNIHIFNDNNMMTLDENIEQEYLKTMEVQVIQFPPKPQLFLVISQMTVENSN